MTVIYESDSNAASNFKMKCIVNIDSGPIEWDSPQEKLNKYGKYVNKYSNVI